MDGRRNDHIDPKEHKQKNRSKQLQTHNLLTGDVKLLTARVSEEIYYSLTIPGLFTVGHKDAA